MKPALRIAGDAIVGQRAEQQDAWGVGTALLDNGRAAKLLVVADGMGGHAGGRIAGMLAVERFLRIAEGGAWSSLAETLRQALAAANRAIGERADGEPALNGMGCTLVGVALGERETRFISVGDSLLLRIAGGRLERLNADHSMTPLLEAAHARGEMTAAEVAEHPQRHLLRSALTGDPLPMIDEGAIDLRGNERLLLATDGLLTLDDADILRIVERARDVGPAGQVAALLGAVAAAGDAEQDNCTIVAVEADRATARSGWGRRVAGFALLAAGLSAAASALWLSRDRIVPARGAVAEAAPVAVVETGSDRRPGVPLPAKPQPATPAKSSSLVKPKAPVKSAKAEPDKPPPGVVVTPSPKPPPATTAKDAPVVAAGQAKPAVGETAKPSGPSPAPAPKPVATSPKPTN